MTNPKTDRDSAADDAEWSDENWEKARAKLGAKHDGSRAARKARQQRRSDSVDGRHLRATGRTAQFNFKSTPGLKARAQEAAAAEGITLAEWMQNAVEAALGARAPGEGGDA